MPRLLPSIWSNRNAWCTLPQFCLDCFLPFDPIGMPDVLWHGLRFWITLKVACNLRGEINIDNYSFSIEWFSRINIITGNFIYPLWLFYISQCIRVKVFRFPSTYICVHICARYMVYKLNIHIIWIFNINCYLSTWCWFAFTIFEVSFLYFSGCYFGVLSFVTILLPLLFWFGRLWVGISTLYGTLTTGLCDFVTIL
jgi:hypothetical protein